MKIVSNTQWFLMRANVQSLERQLASEKKRRSEIEQWARELGERTAPELVVVVKRERMDNGQFAMGFDYGDDHPLWAGMLELLARLERAQIEDREHLKPEEIVTRLDLLDEVRRQMETQRDTARKMRNKAKS